MSKSQQTLPGCDSKCRCRTSNNNPEFLYHSLVLLVGKVYFLETVTIAVHITRGISKGYSKLQSVSHKFLHWLWRKYLRQLKLCITLIDFQYSHHLNEPDWMQKPYDNSTHIVRGTQNSFYVAAGQINMQENQNHFDGCESSKACMIWTSKRHDNSPAFVVVTRHANSPRFGYVTRHDNSPW